MTETTDAAAALFATLTGHAPDGVWSAPGRVNLIGEHTDYNDGFVLPFAIEHRTAVALGVRGDQRIRVTSTFTPDVVEVGIDDLDRFFPTATGAVPAVPEWAAYPLGVAWAIRRASGAASVTGVDLAIASSVPIGAGLSSSAAIECATAVALDATWDSGPDATWGSGLDATTLARVGRTAENEAVGAPTGIMDQMASMLGRPDAAIALDCRSLDVAVVPLGFAEAGLEILVIDTRVAHAHSTGGYRERRAACERGSALMGVAALRDLSIDDLPAIAARMDDVTFRRVRHVVTENQRVCDTVETLRAAGPRGIGELLTASHASMRDDFEISVPELDTAVDAALAAGALGARMTGGGFGGAAIALVAKERRADAAAAVEAAFAASGFTAPHIFTVTPSDGARRDA